MKKLATVILLGGLMAGLANAQPQPQREGLGIGAMVGEPTGISAKQWIDDRAAFDLALGWSFEGSNAFHAHASWLWHDYRLFNPDQGNMPFYVGIGGRFKDADDNRIGIRAPVGVAYHFDDLPAELFGEVAPILDVAPDTSIRFNAAIGVRWYFQ